MDGITEPVILILGHPIAGNPAQFALERGFAALELDWRVLSSDVPPENLDKAIAGGEVLGFRGMLLDESLSHREDEEVVQPNCLYRSPDSDCWQSGDAMSEWLEAKLTDELQSREQESRLLWIGPANARFPASLRDHENQSPIAWASPELIEDANLIAMTDAIDIADWPQAEDFKLVVDLTNDGNDVEAIRSLGYNVIDRLDIMVGTLTRCIECWTGRTPPVDVLTEAIEEYLAV